MMHGRFFRNAIFVAILVILASCGGGGQNDSNSQDDPNINTPPVSEGGVSQGAVSGSLVTLAGSGTDGDGDALTYLWSITSEPNGSNISLSDATIPNPTFSPVIDGNYVLSLIVNDGTVDSVPDSVTISVFTTVSAITPPLNDTGFTWGGNYPSGNNSTCIGETISQQDCSHGRDALNASGNLAKVGSGRAGFDFSNLDAFGGDLPFNAPLWSCVQDNHTNLYWEVKTVDGGIRDRSNSYRWGGKTSQLSGSFGTLYADWDLLVDEANSSSLCGFSDWRVPSRVELSTLVDYSGRSNAAGGASGPNIDTDYFPNTSSIYWSSSPRVDAGNLRAWSVTFGNGSSVDQTGRREFPRAVRLVRSNR